MGAKLIDKGPGLARLQSMAKRLGERPSLRIGVLSSAPVADGSEFNMAELAAVHEFGAPSVGVPERSWLRATYDAKREAWEALLKRALGRVVDGKMSENAALQLVGLRAVADIQSRIRTNIAPALKPRTIARKGSSLALVDTGRFLQSIAFEVMRRESDQG